jgi:predicted ATPase
MVLARSGDIGLHRQTSLIGGRYRLLEQLGEGGMGSVHRAYDLLTGNTVALKRVLVPSERLLPDSSHSVNDPYIALAHEFQALVSLRHPNIVSVLDYGFDHTYQPFFTMEIVENATTLIRAARHIPPPEQIDLLVQLLQALYYLHRRNIIHRDLKPGNILVSNGQVKLLDFGLAVYNGTGVSRGTSGTIGYIAPEVLMGGKPSIASDLYAVGTLTYEMLLGTHPFESDDRLELIDRILDSEPYLRGSHLPDAVTQVIRKLLAKQPERRYADAGQVITALNGVYGQPYMVETSQMRESLLRTAQFVGRPAEFNELMGAVMGTIDGDGGAWLIGGESGVGKSRLIEELRVRAMVNGMLTLRGQAVLEASRLYQVWLNPLRNLVLMVGLEDEEAAILKPLLPEIGALLQRDIPDAPELDPVSTQNRMIAMIIEIFIRQPQPIVLVLEDLQWMRAESNQILNEIVRLTQRRPILIIASFRDDEAPDLPKHLPGMRLMKLGRLSHEGVAQLCTAMIGPTGQSPLLVNILERESSGNAFDLIELLRALAFETGSTDKIATLPPARLESGIDGMMRDRIARLPETARSFLQLAAILGRTLDLKALRAAGFEPDDLLARCASLAIIDLNDQQWRFAHDKFRNVILNELMPDARSHLHRQAAQALEAAYPSDALSPTVMTFHWNEAGDYRRTVHYAVLAGTQALEISAFREATGYFRRALDIGLESEHQQAWVLRQAGETYLWLGDYAHAQSLLEASLTLAHEIDDHLVMVDALNLLSRIASDQGDYETARFYPEEGLALAITDNNKMGMAASYKSLGFVTLTCGQYEQARYYYLASMAVATEVNDKQGMARAMLNLGLVAQFQKNYDEARGYYQACQAIFATIHHQWGIANAVGNLGEIEYTLGNYDEARHYLQESLAICEKTGNRWGVASGIDNLGLVAFAQNDLTAARIYFREALFTSMEIHAIPLSLKILIGIARLYIRLEQPEIAAEIIGLAINHPATTQENRDQAAPHLEMLQSHLNAQQLDDALRRGSENDFETVAAELLHELRP